MLGIYFLITPFDFIPITAGISVSKVMVSFPLIFWFFAKKNTLSINKFNFPLIVYLTLFAMAVLWSIDISAGLNKYITMLLNIGIVILFSYCAFDNYEINFLLSSMALSSFFLVLLYYVFGDYLTIAGRLTIVVNGTRQDPNEMCGFLIFPANYYLNEFLKKKKIIYLFVLILLILLIILSGSRGGSLALIISLAVLCLSSNKKHLNLLHLFIGLLFLLLLIYLFKDFIPAFIRTRFTFEYFLNESKSSSSRTNIWIQLIDSYKSGNIFRILFGYGLGSVTRLNESGSVAHNVFIEALVEAGIIGLLVQIWVYFSYVKIGENSGNRFLYTSLLGYIILSLTLSIYSFKPMWNVVFLIIISSNIKAKRIAGKL